MMTPTTFDHATLKRLLDCIDDPVSFTDVLEDIFRDALVDANLVTSDHYFDLKSVYFAKKMLQDPIHKAMKVAYQTSDSPKDDLKDFPYVKEHGLEPETEEDARVLELIEQWENVNDRMLNSIENKMREKERVGELEKGLQAYLLLMRFTVGNVASVEPAELSVQLKSYIEEYISLHERKESAEPTSEAEQPMRSKEFKWN